MDKKILYEFIETAKPKLLKRYAYLLTNMLVKDQIDALQSIFQVKVSMREDIGKEPQIEEKVAQEPQKQEIRQPQRQPEPEPVARPRPRPQSRPDYHEMEELESEQVERTDIPDDEDVVDDDVENVFAQDLTKEDLEEMGRSQE